MGRARAQRGHEHAARGNGRQRGQPHIAQRPGGQPADGLPARDIARRIGQRNRKAQRRAGRHRLMNGHVAPGHERHRHKPAARAHQPRQKANHAAHACQPRCAGQLARGGGLFVQQHLRARKKHENREHHPQRRPLDEGKRPQAGQRRARHDARRQTPDQIPAHCAPPVMRAHAADGCENNGRHRSGDCHLQRQLRSHALRSQNGRSKRHQNHPPANAQQPRHEAPQQPQQRKQGNGHRLKRHGGVLRAIKKPAKRLGERGRKRAEKVSAAAAGPAS